MKYLKSIKNTRDERKICELVAELYKMQVDDLLEFKTEEDLGLEARGIPEDIRSDLLKIIDLVIEAKMEGTVAV